MFDQFYGAAAAASFTLLGLWWLVVQTVHRSVTADPGLRRMGYHISLYFLLPGTMSLIALIEVEGASLWRTTFAVVSGVGVLQVGLLLVSLARGSAPASVRSPAAAAGMVTGLVVYLAMFLIAVRPAFVSGVAGNVRPLAVEAVLLAVLLFLGVNLAWRSFVSVPPEPPAA